MISTDSSYLDNNIFIPGDIVLVNSNGKMGKLNRIGQKLATFKDAKFTHVLMAIDDGVFIEAMPNSGVTIISILDLIERSKKEYNEYVVFRHEAILKDLNIQQRIKAQALYYYGQSYNYKFIISQKEQYDASYCSELISKIYEDIGVTFNNSGFYDTFPSHIYNSVNENINWIDISDIMEKWIKKFEPYLEYIKSGTLPKNPTNHDVTMLQVIQSIKTSHYALKTSYDLILCKAILEALIKKVGDFVHLYVNDACKTQSILKSNNSPNIKESLLSSIQHAIKLTNRIVEIDNELKAMEAGTKRTYASLGYEEKKEMLEKERDVCLLHNKNLYYTMLRVNSDVYETAAFFPFYKTSKNEIEAINLLEKMLYGELCIGEEMISSIKAVKSKELYLSQNFLFLIADMYYEAMINFYKLKHQIDPSEDFSNKFETREIIRYFENRKTNFNLFLCIEDTSLISTYIS